MDTATDVKARLQVGKKDYATTSLTRDAPVCIPSNLWQFEFGGKTFIEAGANSIAEQIKN
ncbi:MAG: hypothetical protein OXI87_05200 [Albidovulum sp.]|nr:hypothetical protein [Albidovulum sp.]MDE0531554.1 hypothetical protein [Albidovulum sp.]